MKVKQGRISLYAEQKNHGHPPIEFEKKINSSTKNINFNQKLNHKNDPRALNEKKYLYNCIKEIINFLHENGFDLSRFPRFLFKPSNSEFIDIFIFLIKKIDYNYNFYGKWDEEIPVALKFLKYPFSIPKISYSSIPSMYMWPILLGCLKWLTELLHFNNELHKKERKLLEIKSSTIKFLWDQLVFAYRVFLLGDEGYKKIFKIIWVLKKNHSFYNRQKIIKNEKFLCYLIFKFKCVKKFFFLVQILYKKSISKTIITKKIFYSRCDNFSTLYEKEPSSYLPNSFGNFRKRIDTKSIKEKILLSKTIKFYLNNFKKYKKYYKKFSSQISNSFSKLNFFLVMLEINILKITLILIRLKKNNKIIKNKISICKMAFLKIYKLIFLNEIFKKKYFSNIYQFITLFFVFVYLKITKIVIQNGQHFIDLKEENFLECKGRERKFKKNLFELLYLNHISGITLYVSKIKKSQDLFELKIIILLNMVFNRVLRKKVTFIKKARKIERIFNVFKKTFQKIKPFVLYFFLGSQKVRADTFLLE